MRFEAIRIVHPTVVTLRGESDARDENNNSVPLNEELIAIEVSRLTQESEEAKAIAEAKEAKIVALDTLEITHNSVAYDANGKAIGNMSAVMGIANFKYNQAISVCATDEDGEPVLDGSGNKIYPDKEQVYDAIYKETKIWWKGADNEAHEIMIESVCEALEKSMLEVAKVLGV